MTETTESTISKKLKICLNVFLAAVILLTVFIRIRMLAAPLERDEGEYAYAGQLILQGIPPYKLAYNMKMPGIYAAYAAILAVFGQTHIAIHFAVMLINIATIILLYLLTKKLLGSVAATAAAAFFAITSMSVSIQATANAENFVILPAVAAMLMMLKFSETKKILYLISSGLLLGIAFMMKQHAIGFILFGGVFLLSDKPFNYRKIIYSISIYSVFVLLPFLITCLILWRYGVFDKFWFWTFAYARHYVGLNSYARGFELLNETLSKIVPPAFLIWLLAPAGLVWCLRQKQRVFLCGFLVFSFIAVCPGLYFRNHYFLLFLPALALLAGAGVLCISEIFKTERRGLAAVIIILLGWSQCFLAQWRYFKLADPEMISRVMYGFFPFPETLRIAEYIKARSNADDKIAVFGSEPQIYFYANRRSATSYIYTYPLMEPQPYAAQMQREMIEQIEAEKPKFIVVVKTVDSWIPVPECEKLIFQWADKYFPLHYSQIALVEIFKQQCQVVYHWDSDVKPQMPESWIMVLQRKPQQSLNGLNNQ
jgi:hypothetical protein